MTKAVSVAIAAFLFCCSICSAAIGQTVLTFDDLPKGSTGASIPNGYGGLNWDGFNYEYWDLTNTGGSGYEYGSAGPGTGVAYKLADGISHITSSNRFDFIGAYLTAAWRDGLQITATGYQGSIPIYTQNVTVNSTSSTWFDFDFLNVDSLSFTASGGTVNPIYLTKFGLLGSLTQIVMDNFTFTPVPEPSTLALLALASLGLLVRRKFDFRP